MTIGIGAAIYFLTGGSEEKPNKYVGRKIVAADMIDDGLVLTFEDGVRIRIYDGGQSCCEARYMTTDDDIQSLVGHNLRHIEAKDGPTEEYDWDVHETCFVEIATNDGFITLTNHNEHNGYYGGFALSIRELKDA